MRQRTIRRLALATLVSALCVACSSPDSEPARASRDSSTAPANLPSAASPVAAAVCDTVAKRWQRSNTVFTRSDSVARMSSMTESAPVCVVTAVAEDDPGKKLTSFSYWGDSTSQGWRGITGWDADGPDGSSRTLVRNGVRCQVDGEWDGGDDSDSTAERSKRVTERTTCWGDR